MEYSLRVKGFITAVIAALLLIILIGLAVSRRGNGPQTAADDCMFDAPDANCVLVEGPTPTPSPTSMAPPTVMPTVTATPTGAPEALPTMAATAVPASSPVADGHDPFHWHAQAEFGHHHGHDPLDTIFAPLVQEFLIDGLGQTIGHAWETSEIENGWPEGKHAGFKWLYEENTGCDSFNNGGGVPQDAPCVRAYLMQVHSLGTAHAIRTRHHSLLAFFELCANGGVEPCGLVYTGGWEDYGTYHAPYKKVICTDDPNNPPLPNNLVMDQPPYRTLNTGNLDRFFWSSLINPVVESYYDVAPQRHLEIAWRELDPITAPHPDHCYDPAFDRLEEGRGGQYQVFTIKLNLEKFPQRPYAGYTDRWGNENLACEAAGFDCVPLYISESVPQGTALLNRQVVDEDPEIAPILDYDDGSPIDLPWPDSTE